MRGQLVLDVGELLEGEARPLDDGVVDRRLERGRRPARDVVGDLLQRVADGQAGGDLCDREARRLRGERRGARDARVHLDHDDLVGGRVDRELHVRAAGLDPDGANHGDRLVAQRLVLAVGEALLGRDGDRVAGVHAHRVDVLDRADDDDVVVAVAHDLELELAPAQHGLVEEHLPDRGDREAVGHDAVELRLGAHDAAAPASEREGRTHDDRQTDLRHVRARLGQAGRDRAARHPQPGGLHGLAEDVAILGADDGVEVGPDQLDAVALERAVLPQLLGEVQRGLAAERGQQRIGLLLRDHLRDRAGQQRLDVGAGGELGVGHDRRRVGVDEHDLVALLEQHLARLHARVVELRRLPDHDRARAEDHDLPEVVAAGHQAAAICSRKRSKRYSESCGPGPASGWYWTVPPGTSSSVSPSTVRS